jgi:mannosyltransferase
MATAPVRRRALPRLALEDTPSWTIVRTVVGLTALVALSAYLRTQAFNAAFWIDEGLSYGISSHDFFDIPSVLKQDGSPPLYYMTLHVWMGLFGTSEATTHTLSLIFALLTIPVGYWAGRSLFGERAGWFTAILFALNSYLTTYAQETRMYSMLAFFTLVAAASFLHAFVFRRRRYLPVFSVAMALMLYTHNWGAFFIAGSLTALVYPVWASPERRALVRDAVLAYGGTLVLIAAWIPTLLFQIKHTGAPWSTAPSFALLTKAPSMTLDGDRIAYVLLLGSGAGLVAAIERRRGAVRAAVIAGLILFLGTLIWAWIGSQVSPAWAYRYFAVFVAPLLLIAGAGLAFARRIGVVALVIVSAFWLGFNAIEHKSIDRHVIRVASPSLKAGDVVLVTHPEQVPVVDYYMRGGVRYATEFGFVKDPGVADWVDALDRLKATTPSKNLTPVLATVPVGGHVLLMRPVIGAQAGWRAPWTKEVRRKSAEWTAAMQRDKHFKLTGRWPKLKTGYAPRGLRALLYTRVQPG